MIFGVRTKSHTHKQQKNTTQTKRSVKKNTIQRENDREKRVKSIFCEAANVSTCLEIRNFQSILCVRCVCARVSLV